MLRRLLGYLLLSAIAASISPLFGALRLTPAIPLGTEERTAPRLEGRVHEVDSAAVQGGFVAAWTTENFVQITRLDERGEPIGELSVFAVPMASSSPTLVVASDGIDALVVVSRYHQSGSGHLVFLVSADGTITERPLQPHVLHSLTWNGVAYIAITSSTQLLELDREGRPIAEGSLPELGYDPVKLSSRLYVDGRIVWLVHGSGTTIRRMALTNEDGHVIDADWTPIAHEFEPFERLVAAGRDERGMYVVLDRPFDLLLQFLDEDGLPNALPILLRKSYGPVLTTRSGDGALWIVGGGRVTRVTPRPRRPGLEPMCVRTTDDETRTCSRMGTGFNVTTSPYLQSFRASPTLLPAKDGVLIVSTVYVYQGNIDRRMPVAGHFRHRAGSIVLDELPPLAEVTPERYNAAAVAHGDGFLVVWQQQGRKGSEVWIQALDALGVPQKEPRFLANGSRPRIASGGDVAFVVWARITFGAEGIRVDRDGMPIDPTAVTIFLSSVTMGFTVLDVGFDATQFNVFIQHGWGVAASVTFPPAGGEPVVVLRHDLPYVGGGIAMAPGTTLLFGSTSNDLRAVSLRHDLTPRGEPRVISLLAGSPRAAWTGDHFRLVWWHNDHYRVTRVSESGEPLDSEFGRVLGTLPLPQSDSGNFRLLLHGDRMIIATWTQVAVLREDGTGEAEPIDAVEALVSRPDGAILLVTRGDRLSVRMVMP